MIKRFALGAGFLITLLSFNSCDNRKDYFEGYNNAPSLRIFRNSSQIQGESYSDSLKIGVPYALDYLLSDEEALTLSTVCLNSKISSSVVDGKVFVNGSSDGLTQLKISAKDSYGKSAEFDLELTVFRNLPPVASLSADIIAVSSPYEVEVNASKSFDRDAKWGGRIIKYKYSFTGYDMPETTLSTIRYIFGSAGQKKIEVKVLDNNGDWSSVAFKYIVLQ